MKISTETNFVSYARSGRFAITVAIMSFHKDPVKGMQSYSLRCFQSKWEFANKHCFQFKGVLKTIEEEIPNSVILKQKKNDDVILTKPELLQ